MTMLSIVKTADPRHVEQFNPDKLHNSVRAACLSVRSPEGEADMIAKSVQSFVASWCQTKHTVTSADVRRVAGTFLARLHPDAAYLYQNHQLVL